MDNLEKDLWALMKRNLEDETTVLDRIENSLGSGISDVSACKNGREVWIELKVFHGKRLHFRNSQRSWMVSRLRVGSRVHVLARQDDCLYVYSPEQCLTAEHRRETNKKSFSVLKDDLGTPVYTTCKPFDWVEIRRQLFGQ